MNPLLRKLEEDVRAAVVARAPQLLANALACRKAGRPFAVSGSPRFLSDELRGAIYDYHYFCSELNRVQREWDRMMNRGSSPEDREPLRDEYREYDNARNDAGRRINKLAPDIQLGHIAMSASADTFICNYESQLSNLGKPSKAFNFACESGYDAYTRDLYKSDRY